MDSRSATILVRLLAAGLLGAGPWSRPAAVAQVARFSVAAGWSSHATPPALPGPDVRHVRSRAILLSCAPPETGFDGRIEVWMSRDAGRTWETAAAEPTGAGAARVAVESDGRFDFFVVLHNAGGSSSDPPVSGTRPHASVVVDTAPPTLQIHQAEIRSLAGLERNLVVHVSLADEHLGPDGVRLFHRVDASNPWRDGGVVRSRDGQIRWPVNDGLPDTIDVRLVATDLAGNQSIDQMLRVATTVIEPTSRPTRDEAVAGDASPHASRRDVEGHGPRSDAPQAAKADEALDAPDLRGVAAVVVEHVRPAGDAPSGAAPSNGPALRTAQPPAAPLIEQAAALRRRAEQHLAAGEYALAAARLDDALGLAPDRPDLLVALGDALYRQGKLDEAAERFAAALRAEADHIPALEGLALVDATRRRYADARDRLRRVLELRPESGRTWLRYGDVEYRLGGLREALGAWRRAAGAPDADDELIRQAQRRLDYFAREDSAGQP